MATTAPILADLCDEAPTGEFATVCARLCKLDSQPGSVAWIRENMWLCAQPVARQAEVVRAFLRSSPDADLAVLLPRMHTEVVGRVVLDEATGPLATADDANVPTAYQYTCLAAFECLLTQVLRTAWIHATFDANFTAQVRWIARLTLLKMRHAPSLRLSTLKGIYERWRILLLNVGHAHGSGSGSGSAFGIAAAAFATLGRLSQWTPGR